MKMLFRCRWLILPCFLLSMGALRGQNPPGSALRFPYSSLAEEGCAPCLDTFQVLFIRKIFDTGRLLPEWKPVVHVDSLTVYEGKVVAMSDVHSSCHVSPLDFSGYHFSHDFCFDAAPDSAYRHLLARRIYPRPDGGFDTLPQTAIHAEWETGIASGNEGNPIAKAARKGNSGGFLTVGHQRRERLWTLPSVGDWVHLEGLWIWDRGHPPARTEIHPIRFMGIVRQLPDRIAAQAGSQDSVYATRVDIFANGDGGALMNNLPGQPDFVHRVQMSGRKYSFTVNPVIPMPDPQAGLKWRVERQRGDTWGGSLNIFPVQGPDGRTRLRVEVDWGTQPDTAVFARILHCWWDVPEGKHPGFAIHTYEVSLEGIDILMRKEGLSRSEWRFFSDVGGQWIFLNEFLEVDDILSEGLAKSFRTHWPLAQRFRVHVPEGVAFRVFLGGWEADGMDGIFGHVLNAEAPCTPETIKALRKHLLPATPFGLKGCLDDVLGVAHAFPTAASLGEGGEYRVPSTGHPEHYDYCAGKSAIQEDCFVFRYRVRKL